METTVVKGNITKFPKIKFSKYRTKQKKNVNCVTSKSVTHTLFKTWNKSHAEDYIDEKRAT